ncbi:S-4TM family putative pore-forming effector [Thalassovita gelatinovora]|uniref:S-4TM family putative pore-forming effector n=1 Tax=Thalassovita gelatinovora TaxID=53501 RepID=UPI003F5D1995
MIHLNDWPEFPRPPLSDQEDSLKLMDDLWLQICRGVLIDTALLQAARDSQDALYIRRASGTLIFPGIYKLKRSALEGRAARKASTFRAEFENHRPMTSH